MERTTRLATAIEDAVAGLPHVTRRKMFGCDCWFAAERMFALVWKEGRVGVKLPDPAEHASLLKEPGAIRWSPTERMMASQWVLVPASFHGDERLQAWIARAHASAVKTPTNEKTAKKSSVKKR